MASGAIRWFKVIKDRIVFPAEVTHVNFMKGINLKLCLFPKSHFETISKISCVRAAGMTLTNACTSPFSESCWCVSQHSTAQTSHWINMFRLLIWTGHKTGSSVPLCCSHSTSLTGVCLRGSPESPSGLFLGVTSLPEASAWPSSSWSSWFLARAWLSSGCWSHLGREPVGLSLE